MYLSLPLNAIDLSDFSASIQNDEKDRILMTMNLIV